MSSVSICILYCRFGTSPLAWVFFWSGSSQVAKFRDCLFIFISRAQLGVADGGAACDKAGLVPVGVVWVQTQEIDVCADTLVVSCDGHMKASPAATMCRLGPVPVNSSFIQLLPPATTFQNSLFPCPAQQPRLLAGWMNERSCVAPWSRACDGSPAAPPVLPILFLAIKSLIVFPSW